MENNVQERNIAVMVIITIFTCGIGGIVWLYYLVNDVCDLQGKERSGAMDILLSIITCGVYTIYLAYRLGKDVDELKRSRGINTNNTEIICLLLSIFGLGIISYIIIQNSINELC